MPLLPFNAVEPNKAFDLILSRDGSAVRLKLLVTPSLLEGIVFEPDAESQSVLARDDAVTPRFVDVEGREWDLACRLKPEQAQRIAHRLAIEFSRIGLNESEWLRRRAGSRPRRK